MLEPNEFTPIKEWRKSFTGGGLDYVDYLSDRAEVAHWLALSRVFRPRFVRHHGCTLWERMDNADLVDTWLQQFGGDVRATEGFLNRLILADVIRCDVDDETDAALASIGSAIRATWSCALAEAFPDESFDVWTAETDNGPVVSFASRGAPS
ncbi:hypothetical protein [Streptomyces clavuligerus]|uniref:Uncharacterized protein n=1 Tax=Streptomyces clavuligerus TaxID=1901 RepID=Q6TMR5_STRCL|nr:hypothetical protein [Streptomyces clavuligerus]AAQ93558.1 hypothetical protein pSCL2.6.A8.4c [Streptomyces clavuligerus]AXU16853.1 hypothetical protein D1794_29250 [Streptomyces clavuligerus]EDY48728.1 conserved hypothetical protein [Streptomyces clavuligerus]MBY6300987.1 hypothetical protein [Streptomyces clavuligerus]QPJ97082.1 hypothetical protein GE265_28220 [Streptomyces clavuligerus]